ncbi:MAG TPA: hypothetical protein VGP72_24030 [Planctomycetota bacterium]|jgi:hypothetical protein
MRHLLLALWFWPLAVLAGQAELTIRDNIGKMWDDEPIAWALSCEPGVWKGESVQVTRDGKAITAQGVIEEKHPDGSVKSAKVLFLIDQLDKEGATQIRATFGQTGPADTDLKVEKAADALVFTGKFAGVRVLNRNAEKAGAGAFSPILAVRTASGKWTGGGAYETSTCKPAGTKTELLESGPVRLRARVTTTFDNGRKHAVTVSLWSGSHCVDIEEQFDLGPDDKYRFKEYKDDRDELAWEWWSWYGDKDGTQETHPNYWVFQVSGPEFQPAAASYRGEASTDPDKGDPKQRGGSKYTLSYAAPKRLEKYLCGHDQWRPDAVTWYAVAPASVPAGRDADAQADVVALFTHSVCAWRNPNILPTPQGITLRTGTNDMRIISQSEGKKLSVHCPIGLGSRVWSIRCSTAEESFRPKGGSPTNLSAEIVKRNLGLDVTRSWVTDWNMTFDYPRLFIKPQDKDAYYARLKGKGIGAPGNPMDFFLRHQDQANFDKDYAGAIEQADRIVGGYFSTGCDNTNGYPGWMLGYWHGIVVANALDNLAGSPLCKPEQARALKKKLAIIIYGLTSKNSWPDKQINYGWGSMNMPVGRWGGLVVMASAISDHPMAKEWLKDAGRYFKMLLQTEYAPDGTQISCPHYIGASSTSFYAWIAMANSGAGEDVSTSPVLKKFARYYMQLMTPIDPRWGIRTLINEGDSRPGSSPLPGILGTLFRNSDPELAGQLMQMWHEGGSEMTGGMGVPDALIIDPAVAPKPLALGPEVYPGFGAILRHRALSTPEEEYLVMLGGDFMIDHANVDQLAFHWHEKGVPLTVFNGSMYQPMACTSLSHNTISWDIAPGGAKDPGKDQPGNWYHEHNQPHVDLGGITPTLHWEIGFDREKQKITETRGKITRAGELPGATLLEGQVNVKALVQMPTKPANDEVAIASQAWPPAAPLAKPFTWTRRILSVRAETAAGMNYLVVRDDFGEYAEKTPFFSYWNLGDGMTVAPASVPAVPDAGSAATLTGALGVDTEMFVLQPQGAKLEKGRFVNKECEGIVGGLHRKKHNEPFQEVYTLCRAEGQKGKGFLVVLFPHKTAEPKPKVEPWLGSKGVKVSWQGEQHFILLAMSDQEINADGIQAKTSCLVLKLKDKENFELSLPLGGKASLGAQLDSATPVGVRYSNRQGQMIRGKDLIEAAPNK